MDTRVALSNRPLNNLDCITLNCSTLNDISLYCDVFDQQDAVCHSLIAGSSQASRGPALYVLYNRSALLFISKIQLVKRLLAKKCNKNNNA